MELAHAFGARYDLPIPLYLFLAGGALVVLLSFAFVVPRAVEAAASRQAADRPPLVPVREVPSVLSLLLLAFLCYCGLAGSQEVAENLLPTVFWLLVWIAVPLSCGLVGDWTRNVNPFAALSRWADSPRLRRALLGSERSVRWPARLAWWPAVVLFVAAVLGELVFNVTSTVPHVLATGLVVYAALCLAGGLLFGTAWRERGELFTVLFSTWGRLGYWRFSAPGPRGFGGGLRVDLEASLSRIAFVLLLLISVNFDGLLTTPQWGSFERSLPDRVGLDPGRTELFRTVALVVLAVLLFALFTGFAVLTARVAGRSGAPRESLVNLVPSLMPIAFGYLFVHNLQYVLVNAQLMLPLLGNPTGNGSWPLSLPYPFNDDYEVHRAFLPSSFYWYVGVAVIVVVHIAAVVVAHRHLAVRVAAGEVVTPERERRAHRSEYPWLVAMVAYTMASLWLIAQPFTESTPAPRPSSETAAPAVTAPLAAALDPSGADPAGRGAP